MHRNDVRDQMMTAAREMREAADKLERRAHNCACPRHPRVAEASFLQGRNARMEGILSQDIADDMHKVYPPQHFITEPAVYVATINDTVSAGSFAEVTKLLAEAEDNIPGCEARRQIERVRKAIMVAMGHAFARRNLVPTAEKSAN